MTEEIASHSVAGKTADENLEVFLSRCVLPRARSTMVTSSSTGDWVGAWNDDSKPFVWTPPTRSWKASPAISR